LALQNVFESSSYKFAFFVWGKKEKKEFDNTMINRSNWAGGTAKLREDDSKMHFMGGEEADSDVSLSPDAACTIVSPMVSPHYRNSKNVNG